jgi:hypothetical protein
MCVSGIVLRQNFDNLQKKKTNLGKTGTNMLFYWKLFFFTQNIVTFIFEIKKLEKKNIRYRIYV